MKTIPQIGTERALFIAHKMRDELIYNMAKAEGNSLSFAETQTVINGISVGGKPMFELKQIEHIRDGWNALINQVQSKRFVVDKENFIHLNALVAAGENPEIGGFRTRPVSITGTHYSPPLPMLLNEKFREMMEAYQSALGYHKGLILFLQTARHQYFADGNKRTGQLMMNGELMMNGYPPITIAPKVDTRYRDELLRFYESGTMDSITEFLIDCANDERFALMF